MSVYVIPTVTAPATVSASQPQGVPTPGPYDLTTLAIVHDELNIPVSDTAKDAFLQRVLTEASLSIAGYCNRVFAVEGLSDEIYIRDDRPERLQLSRSPVANFATLATNVDAPPNTSTLAFAAAVPAFVALGAPVSGLNVQPGTTVSGKAGNSVTISLPVTDDVPVGTPITLGFAVQRQIQVGQIEALVLGVDYQLDPKLGHLLRLNTTTGRTMRWEGWSPITVAYSAGYATIPPDLGEACLRIVTERFWRRGVDPSIKETEDPRVGRKVWWVGGPPKTGGLPEEITGTLDRYRVPVIS